MDRQQILRDDRTSDCHSFGSNYHPSSQARKISIGIMIDSSLQTKAKNVNQDVAAAPSTEDKTSSKENTFKEGSNRNEVTVPAVGKQSELSNKENSPWVSTRSLHQKLPSSPEANVSKQALHRPATSNVINRPNGTKKPLTVPSVRYFENQASTLQASDGMLKKFCKRTNGKVAQRYAALETEQQKTIVAEKDVVEDKAKRTESAGNETLRMKLWEILGTVSSPAKQLDSQAFETGKHNLKPGQENDGENVSPVVDAKQNSNDVGNGSGSPNHTTIGPVTRSRTRRKSPSKVEANKVKHASANTYKEKHHDNHIFSFEEGWSGKLSDPISGGSSMSKIKDDKIKSFKIKPRKLSFRKHDNAHETQLATERSNTKPAAKKSLSPPQGNTAANNSLPRKKIELVHLDNDIQGKDSHSSPVIEKNMDHLEDSISPFSKNSVEPQDGHCSPNFKINTVIEPSSPESLRKTSLGKFDVHSPARKDFNAESIRSFKNFLNLKSDYYMAKEQVKSPDDVVEHEDSPVAKSVHFMSGSPSQNRNSESSSGTSDSESSENCSSDDGDKCVLSDCKEPEYLSPEVAKAEKQKFMFHPAKRHRSQNSAEVMFSPSSVSLKETEERSNLHEPPELDEENELASAVSLLALALERVKKKIESRSSKRTSEILKTAAQEIHLQLQNAESQMLTDVGKLLSLGKTKRKRLETRFQEQQEELKMIHGRFLEEVKQHIQECKGTLEGVEAQRMELKGHVEKQKAMHRKLLSEAQESVESQLNEAQRKISSVHKVARGKMGELKYVMAELLKDDIF